MSITGPAGVDATRVAFVQLVFPIGSNDPELILASIVGTRWFVDGRGDRWIEIPAGTFTPGARLAEEFVHISPDGDEIMTHRLSDIGERGGVSPEGGVTFPLRADDGTHAYTFREVVIVPYP